MYIKRIHIANYGPIRNLDISLPFDEERPKSILLVGENGSGKSILLSHIVNGMITAKDAEYQESTELDAGKVFKLRSNSYIAVGAEYYFARIDFESGLFVREMRLRQPKSTYTDPPMGAHGPGSDAWESAFTQDALDYFDTNLRPAPDAMAKTVSEIVSANTLLYFPSNRMEEPAWLNRSNLRAKPKYTKAPTIKGETRRRIVAHSPLRDVHDWLYDVAYDRAAFEIQSQSVNLPIDTKSRQGAPPVVALPLFLGYRGDATNVYDTALQILRAALPNLAAGAAIRFGIGGRHNRLLSIESDSGTLVPNVFQLSSGEQALLALFLSILRDFDLREDRSTRFSAAKDIRGLVVIDEADLHLHSRHQHEVLPQLIQLFPQVQFVMTTHSPLFVLGMAKLFGEDGFAVYDLPTGSRVGPEEFDEFGEAFRVFKTTNEFSDEVRAQAEQSQQPLLYVEGTSDCDYLRRAADLLGRTDVLAGFTMDAAGGEPQLKAIWNCLIKAPQATTKSVVILYDPECDVKQQNKGSIRKMKMPLFDEHPISKGIENLFGQETLEKARQHRGEFIDIVLEHTKIERGVEVRVPDSWTVNEDEKRNLCDWLCEHGTREDFRHFEKVFEILSAVLYERQPSGIGADSQVAVSHPAEYSSPEDRP